MLIPSPFGTSAGFMTSLSGTRRVVNKTQAHELCRCSSLKVLSSHPGAGANSQTTRLLRHIVSQSGSVRSTSPDQATSFSLLQLAAGSACKSSSALLCLLTITSVCRYRHLRALSRRPGAPWGLIRQMSGDGRVRAHPGWVGAVLQPMTLCS